MKSIVLVGGGGHCRSAIEVIDGIGEYRIKGILDRQLVKGSSIDGIPVLGDDNQISELHKQGSCFCITVGMIDSAKIRMKLATLLDDILAVCPVLAAANASISKSAALGAGTLVMQFSLVNAAAIVGKHCILNSQSLVEHGAVIGDFCHISTGAIVNGEAKLEDQVMLGAGAIVRQGVRIASNVVIGAGAVVVKDISEPGVYTGIPAVKLK